MATAAVAPSAYLPSAMTASSLATPPSYASLAFPLPEKRYVGMLRCQIDPLAQTLVTTVARCDKIAPAAKSGGGKKAKGALSEVDAPPAEEWEVELFDTVLFPEGGGQPSDTGRLVPLVDGESQDDAAGEPAIVRQVIRRNLDAVHFVSRPFEVGAKVRVEVDWQRRRDHQDQHTGQHLLSAVLEHECHLDTLSWSLQKFPELSYIELPRAPTPEEIAAVQARCNDLIGEARPIRVNFELATKETGVELGEKVPANYKSDESGEARPPVQRTVIIEGVDTNPCCGTHYPSLAYLRTLYLSPFTTSIRGTNARVYFACGAPRVLAHLEGLQLAAREAALAVGCAVQDLPKKVEGLVGGVTEAKRREKKLAGELAGWVASDLWDRAQNAAAEETEDKVVKALGFREDDATNSLEFLTAIAGELKPRIDALPQGTKHLIVLACGATASSPGAATAGGAVLIVGSDDLVLATGKKVVETFGKDRIKGGGKGRWQGKMTGRWENGDEILLKRAVEAVA
ncbi:putative alanine--tRNA ligase [Rhodotorula paludigena]|uniref:putative alanine--tRNA ligase n=1 Tax=Rhodotorula paludigena TaxID=86838 RepID=UPI003171B056